MAAFWRKFFRGGENTPAGPGNDAVDVPTGEPGTEPAPEAAGGGGSAPPRASGADAEGEHAQEEEARAAGEEPGPAGAVEPPSGQQAPILSEGHTASIAAKDDALAGEAAVEAEVAVAAEAPARAEAAATSAPVEAEVAAAAPPIPAEAELAAAAAEAPAEALAGAAETAAATADDQPNGAPSAEAPAVEAPVPEVPASAPPVTEPAEAMVPGRVDAASPEPPLAEAPAPPAEAVRPEAPSRDEVVEALREAVRSLEQQLVAERELRQRVEAEAEEHCGRDAVTGLANAVRFHDRLAVAVAHARRQNHKLAVVHVSLDGFDVLLERVGVAKRDDLLRGVASALEAALRQGDTIARFGPGECFTVLVPGLSRDEDVTVIAEKLRIALRGPFTIDGSRLLTATLGIAVFPEDGAEADALLQNAALALDTARARGGDAWDVHAPGPRARAARRVLREAALRRALARDALALYWRPVVACGTRAVVGMEAVIRWRGAGPSAHPSDFVLPRDVPNLAVPLGQWLLRRACREAARWHADSALARVVAYVGLSGRQLAHVSLLDLVQRVLDESGLPPSALRLGIAQRDLHSASPSAVGRLQQLRQLGIRVALQTFGTGDSRLLDPQRYSLDELDLDQSVGGRAPSRPDQEAVVAAAIALAHSRGVLVLADGAHTETHAELFAGLGCDYMQGRACGLPMPAADAEPWLRAQAATAAVRP